MPRVTIPGVGDVQFPDNMSRDEIMSRATAMQSQASQPEYDPRDLSTSQLIKGGFSRGIEGLKGTAFDLIPALGASIIGKKDYAREQLKEYADRMAAEEEINPTAYKSYKDVQSLGDVLPFAAETIGELGPDALSFIGGAGIGTQIGKQVAKRSVKDIGETIGKRGLTDEAAAALEKRVVGSAVAKGANIGAKTGLFGSSMATNVPDVFQSVYEATGSMEPVLALTIGPIVGLLDTYLPSKLLSQLGPAGKSRLAADLLGKSEVVPVNFKRAFGAELLKTVSGEGLTEAAQEALTIAAEQIAGDNKGFFDPKNIDRIITSSLKGAIGGTTLGAPGAALEAKRAKDIAAAEINRRAAAGEITPQEQQQQILALGYDSFTPVGLPDGTIAMTKAELDAYQQRQFDQKFAPQDADAAAVPQLGMSTPTMPVSATGTVYPNTQTMRDEQANQAAQAEQQAFDQRTAMQPVEGYQADMFPEELGLAQAQARAQALPPTIDQTLAGPPEAPAQFKTTLDADSLKGTGLKPQSGFFKQLLGKDMANPEDQQAVAKVLAQVRSNPSIADSTKKAVESVATQAFSALAGQTNMVGPRGGIRNEVNYGRVQPRSTPEADRGSVQVPEQQVPEPTQGIGTPEQSGLGATGISTGQPGVREAVQPDTLTEQTVEPAPTIEAAKPAVQAAPAKKTKAPTPTKDTAKPVSKEDRAGLIANLRFLEDALEGTVDPTEIRSLNQEIRDLKKKIDSGKYQVTTKDGIKTFTGDVAQLAKDLRAVLDRMGLRNVGLNLERALTNSKGEAVSGIYANKLIEVALNASNPAYTLGHEALHAMKEMGFFSPNDWNILRRHAQTWMNKYDIASRYPGLSQEEQIEEAIAEAFASYQQQEPRIASMFEKAMDALQKLGNFISGLGFRSSSDIFGEASSGALAKSRAEVIDAFDAFLDTNVDKEPKYQVAAAKNVFNKVDNVIRNSPVGTDTQKAVISNGIGRAGEVAKSSLLALLPMHALGEIADSVFPGLGSKFNSLINERAGYQDKLNNGIDPAMKELKDAIKTRPEQRKAFNKIVNDSTVDEVDPTKPRSYYKGKTDSSGNSKEAAWDKLNKEYNKLSPVWKVAYKTMRDAYKQMYNETISAIELRIDQTNVSDDTKKIIKADILERLAKRGMIEPYFALGREGDKWLSYDYKDDNGQVQRAHEAFKSNYERDTRKAELGKAGATNMQPYSKLSEVNYRNAPPGSFVNSVLQVMDVNKPVEPKNATPDQQAAYEKALKGYEDSTNEIMRLFISTLPETAFAKSFQKRKGEAGYMEDTIGVFERKMRSMAHQVANMRFNPQLSAVVNEMTDQARLAGMSGDNATQVAYADEFKKHLGYALNPTKNDIGSILTSAAFTYTLGFNVSSAIVNMANIPMIVAPYLKGRYADSAVASALGNAAKDFTGSGTKTKLEVLGGEGRQTEMDVMPSITNYAPDSAMGKKYATLIRIGKEKGQLNRSQLYEILNGDTRTGAMTKFNAWSGWMFHHGERMNREVTMLATYNLEMERLKKPSKADVESIEALRQEMNDSRAEGTPEFNTKDATEALAANQAIYVNELTNGGVSAAAAPRFAQNPLGKIIFMYKRYGVSMYYMMFKTFKQATQGNTPEERQAAWRQLGGIVGMSGLMAGAQGIPMYGALSLLYSMFCDEDDEDLDTVTRKALGEFVYKGPLEYATNLAIAGRITLNDLILRDSKGGAGSATFSQQLLQALGGPVVGVADRISRGYSKLNEGHTMRAMEDLFPSAIANGFKGVRYLTEGTTTLRGDPITGDVSVYNAMAQALGFAPADYTRQLEINATEKGIDKTLQERSHKLKQKYYMAKRNGDTEGMADVKDKMLEMGEKHPELGISQATIKGVLDRSMTAQERATKEMLNGVRYSKKRLEAIKASLAEYED
jgi:hypothetical protein